MSFDQNNIAIYVNHLTTYDERSSCNAITNDYRSTLDDYSNSNKYDSENNIKYITYTLLLNGAKSYRHSTIKVIFLYANFEFGQDEYLSRATVKSCNVVVPRV